MSDYRNHMSIDDEIRVLENFISMMPKSYRKRNHNWVVVQDIIMDRTRTAGCTSCMDECRRLGIDPYGYALNRTEADNG